MSLIAAGALVLAIVVVAVVVLLGLGLVVVELARTLRDLTRPLP